MEFKLILLVSLMLISTSTSKKMNILFLMADDMRPNLGAYEDINKDIFSQPKMHTPNLDALAAKSMVFEKAYVQQALCSPSRTSALTGRRPDTTRISSIGYYWREYGGNFTTIPQFFKEHGYFTLGAGKLFHGGPSSDGHDCPYSWDVCPYHDNADPIEDDHSHSWIAFSEEQIAEQPLLDTMNADWLINRMRAVVKDEEPPYFIGYGVHKPHLPFFFPERFLDYYPEEEMEVTSNPYAPQGMPDLAWHPPPIFNYDDVSAEVLNIPHLGEINVTLPDWKAKELRRAYYSAISHADDEIGRVLEDLKLHGLENDTIIVFWGDHGWDLGDHSHWCKLTLFETDNRVPFMIHIPGVTDQGMRSSKLVEMVDIFPTLVELAGFETMDRCPIPSNDIQLCSEGRSILPLFEDPDKLDWDNTIFWQHSRGGHHDDIVPNQMAYSIRVDHYRYTEYLEVKDHGDQTWEPLWDEPADHEELYDLEIDSQERINRYNDPEYIVVKEELAKKLRLGWSARK